MLPAKVQYALVIVNDLRYAKEPTNMSSLAKSHDLSIDLLEQVARKLRLARIIDSVRGPKGGYLPLPKIKSISLLSIFKALGTKPLKSAINSKDGFNYIFEINSELQKKLSEISLL